MEVKSISRSILRWYARNGAHHLPWRATHDPYHILVSEIMLQQTQVDRVIPKYKNFLRAFPTVTVLSKAPLTDILRAWSGLGYNRRAVYVKKFAEACVRDHNGIVPSTYEALLKLPGIGDYTARAVLSFAFNERITVIDTNIRRVFARVLFGKNPSAVEEKRLVRAVTQYLPVKNTALYHGALMDVGREICRSAGPRCTACPLQAFCKAFPKISANGTSALKGRVVARPQPRFEGSLRKVRGGIIDILRDGKRHTAYSLARLLKEPSPRISKALTGLMRDGLVTRKSIAYKLPS